MSSRKESPVGGRPPAGPTPAGTDLPLSRNLLAQVIHALPQRVFWKDRAGVYQGCNAAFAKAAGMADSAKIVGLTDHDLPWSDQAEAYRAEDRGIMESNRPMRQEVQMYRGADGATAWVETTKIPLTDEAGRVTAVLGIAEDITARKLAAEALEEREKRLTTLGRNIPGVIYQFRLTPDGVYSFPYVNERWLDLFGISPKDAMASADSSMAVILPEDRARVDQEIRHSARTMEPWICEFRIRVGERVRWMHGHSIPDSPDGDGSILWNGVLLDVTEHKLAELALEEGEKKLRSIFEDSPAGVAVVAVDGRYLVVNPAFSEIFGYSAEELLRGSFFDVTHPDDRERSAQIMRQVLEKKGRNVRFAKRYLHKDGHTIWAEVSSELVFGPDGQPVHFITHVIDVTERKQAEAKIAEQAALLETANDAIIVRDLEHRILYWNKGSERLYGWKAAEALGRRSPELVDMDPPGFDTAFAQFMKEGAWAGELRNRAQDGRELVVLGRWTLVRDEAGQPKSVLVINADITEKKQLQSQLLRAQRLESIGQLASGVAHDLNNILAPMIMVAPLLRMEVKKPEILRLIDILESNTRRGADVVKQILTFARGLKGDKGPVPTRPLLKEVATVVEETFPKAIAIEASIPEDLWMVDGDATQLLQVLMNLSVNARDAMPNGGTLTLAGENLMVDETFARITPQARPGPYVVWLIADTGDGIAPEILDRIFDPFFTTKEVGKGTGLGLSTAMGIVRSHGGFIKVESKPGKGTRFRVYLPALAEQPAVANAPLATAPRGRDEAILVVDDEEGVRVTTKKILEHHGYRVFVASEGSEAVALFARHQGEIKVVLTDLMMPVMDGVALVRAVRGIDPGIRVLATTGVMETAQTTAVTQLGVRAVIRKPFSPHQLLCELRATLDDRDGPVSADAGKPPE